MRWAGGEPQPFRPAWHRWVVDRLNVNAVFGEQNVADFLRADGVADHQGDDVRRRVHYGQASIGEAGLEIFRRRLLRIAFLA